MTTSKLAADRLAMIRDTAPRARVGTQVRTIPRPHCPTCRCTASTVRTTRYLDGDTLRRRTCDGCGYRWVTRQPPEAFHRPEHGFAVP